MRKYQSALVLGLGASGEAAARLLLAEGTDVIVLDRGDDPELRRRAKDLEKSGARIHLGAGSLPVDPVSVCIASPGLPLGSAWIADAKRRGASVISELELGWSRARCKVLAVTGSNGKSTLVRLCAAALAGAGFKTAIAGNHEDPATGRPLPVSRVVIEHERLEWLVLEVSSFQLETVEAFRPDVGVLLNVFPNHLDRHGSMDVYRMTKLRMFSMMTGGNVGIVPASMLNSNGPALFESGNARLISFGDSGNADFRYVNGRVFRGRERLLSVSGTMFDNEVLGASVAAAAAAACACGIGCDRLEDAARAFKPLPHRVEDIGSLRGVRFIDDSKGTNIEAACAALRMTRGAIRLIAGGKPKGDDYSAMPPAARGRVVKAYLIGKAAEAMQAAWQGSIPCVRSSTLDRAVREAFEDSAAGETILLSPGCSSMDQFDNYMDRGNRFRQCMEELKKNA